MAPTPITVQDLKGPFDTVTAGQLQVTTVAPDTANGNSFKATGREILLINNGTGSPVTITITSTPDLFNRTGNITSYSIPAGTLMYFTGGLTNEKGWKQTDGTIIFTVTGTGSAAAVLRLP